MVFYIFDATLSASSHRIIQKNILKEGLKILNSAGTVENMSGAINKTSAKKHKAVEPEAHPPPLAWVGSSQPVNSLATYLSIGWELLIRLLSVRAFSISPIPWAMEFYFIWNIPDDSLFVKKKVLDPPPNSEEVGECAL